MDERHYEHLKRRHHDLMERAREVVDEARRIHLDFRRRSAAINAWNSRIGGRTRAGDDGD